MTNGFNHFTLKEVYQYAESLGYTRKDVFITDDAVYDEFETQFNLGYFVNFGHGQTETWMWYFKDLDQPAVGYEHQMGKN